MYQLNEDSPGFRLVQRYACMMGLDFDLAFEFLVLMEQRSAAP